MASVHLPDMREKCKAAKLFLENADKDALIEKTQELERKLEELMNKAKEPKVEAKAEPEPSIYDPNDDSKGEVWSSDPFSGEGGEEEKPKRQRRTASVKE